MSKLKISVGCGGKPRQFVWVQDMDTDAGQTNISATDKYRACLFSSDCTRCFLGSRRVSNEVLHITCDPRLTDIKVSSNADGVSTCGGMPENGEVNILRKSLFKWPFCIAR